MLVRKIEGTWRRWNETDDRFMVAVGEVRVRLDDDDNTEHRVPVGQVIVGGKPLEPYQRTMLLSTHAVEAALANGSWSTDDLAPLELAVPVPFADPEGRHRVGAERFEERDGQVFQVFDVEDDPPPPPPQTAEEKLASAGLTEADLDDLIAKSLARQAAKT